MSTCYTYHNSGVDREGSETIKQTALDAKSVQQQQQPRRWRQAANTNDTQFLLRNTSETMLIRELSQEESK